MSVCVHRPSLRLFAVAERKQGSIDADEMKWETGEHVSREQRVSVAMMGLQKISSESIIRINECRHVCKTLN